MTVKGRSGRDGLTMALAMAITKPVASHPGLHFHQTVQEYLTMNLTMMCDAIA